MKMQDAQDIICGEPLKVPGFMVSFEIKDGCILESDYFPDQGVGEPLIKSERHAWDLARAFAKMMVGRALNVYVVDSDYKSVPNYEVHQIENRE